MAPFSLFSPLLCTIPVLLILLNLYSFIPWEKLLYWFFVVFAYAFQCITLQVDLSPAVVQVLAQEHLPGILVQFLLFIEDWVRGLRS